MTATIVLEDLSKHYGSVAALDGLNLTIQAGTCVVVLGTNGAGKTTALDCLVGVKTPTRGRILLDGRPVKRLNRTLPRGIGFLPENFEAAVSLTVSQNVEYFGGLYGMRDAARPMIELLDLTEISDRDYATCSRGERLKTNIALTLVHDPQLLILDEPTLGLDPRSRRKIWDVIRDCRSRGKQVIFSTHSMEEAEALGDHVVILKRGKCLDQGSVHELVARHGEASHAVLSGIADDDVSALTALLPQYAFERRNGSIRVGMPRERGMVELVTAVEARAIRCDDIHWQRDSLESAFLRLVAGP